MPPQRLGGQDVEADALHAAGRARETAIDHFLLQSHGFENLSALVGLQRRDAHLGHDLSACPWPRPCDSVPRLSRRRGTRPTADAPRVGLPQRFEGQVGIDRIGPVADQQTVMMHFACLARFQHDADAGPLRLAHQMMMHGTAGQQRTDGNAIVDSASRSDSTTSLKPSSIACSASCRCDRVSQQALPFPLHAGT